MRFATFHRAVAVLICIAGLAGPSVAEDRVPGATEQAARRLLDEVETVYKAMPDYADHGEFGMEGFKKWESVRHQATFDRPSSLYLDCCENWIIASNGVSLTTVVPNGQRYKVSGALPSIDLRLFKEDDYGIMALGGGCCGPPTFAVFALLTEPDGVDVFLSHWGTKRLSLEGDQNIDGVRLKTILVENSREWDFRLFINEKSKLLLRIEILRHPEDPNRKPALGEVQAPAPAPAIPAGLPDPPRAERRPYTFAWTSGTISDKKPPASAFAYSPPKDFEQVDSFDGRHPATTREPVERLIGKSAPKFTLTLRDGPGGFSRLSKSDLRGKVVLLHFWLNQNALARGSVARLTEVVGGRKDGLAVVSVCQDKGLQDLTDFRRLRESAKTANLPRLPETFLRLNAIDPTKEVGDAFAVRTLPTVVLIDARGVIQKAIVGVDDHWSANLKEAVEKLLAGETLLGAPLPNLQATPP